MSQLELLTESGMAEQALWSSVAKTAGEVQKREIRPYILLALKELAGDTDSRLRGLPTCERYACVRAVVRHLARLRSARAGQTYKIEDVRLFLEGLRFTNDCVQELATLLCNEDAYSRVPVLRPNPRFLQNVSWRLDISLCQVNIDPTSDQETQRSITRRDAHVIMTFDISDGTRFSCRLSVARAQELRFAVATLLKQMLVLERRKCMKRE